MLDREYPGSQETPTQSDRSHAALPGPAGRERGDQTSSKRRGKLQVNRHGLPLLDDKDDLHRRFDRSLAEPSPSDDHSDAHTPLAGDCSRKDKHGIPVLDHCHDLGRLLSMSAEDALSDEELAVEFERSIAHDTHTLIKKKTGGIFPARKLTLKERLKRYPRPQGQMDLHGATADQARQRTDAYIRNALADGLFTVRIIVGKGLHSEAGAVLPDVVEDRLIQLKRDGCILSYRWEKGLKRKSGAVIVYLETNL